jgi:hypothetical protein
MTLTEHAVAGRNFLISLVALLVLGGVAASISALLQQPFVVSLFIVFALTSRVAFAVILGQKIHGRRVVGRLLFDCGLNPFRKSFLTTGVACLFMAGFIGSMFPLVNERIVRIPSEFREPIDSLLRSYSPVQTNA